MVALFFYKILMKKTLNYILPVVIMFALIACGNTDDDANNEVPFDCGLSLSQIDEADAAYTSDASMFNCRRLRNLLADYVDSNCPANPQYEQRIQQLDCDGGIN